MNPASGSIPTPNLVTSEEYIRALSAFVRLHESKLADFARRPPPPTVPSWTTVLTLGVLSSEVPAVRKPPLILRLDPHHLYFLLLKAEEAGIAGIGSLDVLIDGGPTRPMSINYGADFAVPGSRLSGGMLDRDSDAMSFRSTFSAVSSFSLGSGWWGSSPPPPRDESIDVKYLYSSMTKLPALRLVPFTFSSAPSSAAIPTLSKPVKDFQDCPPPETAVPLRAFKNLSSLIIEDLDPRAFLGWDVLSLQLRSLEVKRSGIEDLGELLCDAVVEDYERSKKGRGGVGSERRRRQGQSQSRDDLSEQAVVPHPASSEIPEAEVSAYPVPPASAWSRLVHLSVSSNSLTFIPSTPLLYLTALTSLDLSSNLLISIPSGLSALHSLRSLNLSDNMIDSLLGVSKALGNVIVINLSKNRIDNLSGLDRLFALERIDLRENRLSESLEISRLATLPCLKEVWIEGNSFAKGLTEGGEEHYRAKCFSYFVREGKNNVKLDGSEPSSSERRGITAIEESQGRYSKSGASSIGRRASSPNLTKPKTEEARSARNAKLVERRIVTTPHPSKGRLRAPIPESPFTPSQSTSALDALSPESSPTLAPESKPRRRKPRRIVDLDGQLGTAPPPPSSTGTYLDSAPSASDPDLSSSPSTDPFKGHNAKSGPSLHLHSASPLRRDGSASLGPATGRATRRERISASTYDDPSFKLNATSSSNGGQEVFSKPGPEQSGEAFRKRVEALRNEVGESWLSVLGEREAANERKNQSEESDKGKGVSSEGTSGVSKAAEVQVVKVVGGKKNRKGKKGKS